MAEAARAATAAKTPPAPPNVRVNSPTVLQMEGVECGAASLAMILGHYGRWVPLEELRVACGVSRDGSKASNVLRAARTFGMTAKGYKKEPEGLRAMQLPVTVFWNFNHYLVVEGFVGDKVFLNDPASGKRVVTAEEFDQSYTGVVLAITPGPDYRPGGEKPRIIRLLRKRFTGAGDAVSLLVACGLALVIPGMVIPVFGRVFIDEILVSHRESWVLPLFVGMALTAVLRAVLKGFEQFYLLRIETKMALATTARFFWHVLRLPVEFYTQRSPGDISARVSVDDRIAKVLTVDLANSILSVATSLFFAVLMFFYDPLLAAVAVSMVGTSLFVMQRIADKNRELNRKLAMDGGKLASSSMHGLALMETIKSAGGEAGFFSKWSGYQAKFLNSQQKMAQISVNLAQLPTVLTAVGNALILGMGAMRVMDGAMTMGTLVAFQSLVASFMAPANQLVGISAKLQQMQGDVDRADDVMKYRLDPLAQAPAGDYVLAQEKLKGYIEFRNVTFGYNRAEAPFLQDFTLSLKPGQRIALVGPSGCGKSTVSKLLMGLYEPWSGEILSDGKPRTAHDRFAMINSIGMVDQDIVIFSGTVRDNITMWDTTVTESDIVRAAQDACIHDVILERPGGYDLDAEEGGRNFSGGQRQRLEIARALVNNPRILVLDEATSALDATTEKQLDDNLRRRGCACVIVAHRLSTIRDADEIIVLQRGKVVQRGTHAEMVKDPDGFYYQLVSSQAS